MARLMERLTTPLSPNKAQRIEQIVATFKQAHQEVYGVLPMINLSEFKTKFEELELNFFKPNAIDDSDYSSLFVEYFIYNKETNQAPYNTRCNLSTMTSTHAYHTGWQHVLESKQMNNLEKIGNNNNISKIKSYFNIDEYDHEIVLKDGIETIKVSKKECSSILVSEDTYFIPKDMRLTSHYDYQAFLDHVQGTVSPLITCKLENGMTCYGAHVCSTYPVHCSPGCPKYKKLRYLLGASEIPKRYLKPLAFIENGTFQSQNKVLTHLLYSIKETIADYVEEGTNLFLYSTDKGNGKTSWAITFAKYFIFNQLQANKLVPEAYFVSVPEYFTLLKNSFNDEDLRIEVLQMQNLMKDIPLLILDDLGAEKPSDFVREQLYTIINSRYMNQYSTIYTSNLDIHSEQAKEILGARVVSRIKDSVLLHFNA